MKAKIVMGVAMVVIGGAASAEVTVDTQTLEMVIPSLTYGGSAYSARLSYANGCFVPYEILPLSVSGGTTPTRVTINHDGFDFSEVNGSPAWEQSDGYITAWANLDYPAGYEYGSALWYTPYEYASEQSGLYIQDMGAVSLDSITSVPSDWSYTSGMTDNPLIVGHTYVARARDGHVKFQVVSVGVTGDFSDSTEWTADIDYVFTSGSTF